MKKKFVDTLLRYWNRIKQKNKEKEKKKNTQTHVTEFDLLCKNIDNMKKYCT